MGKIFEITNAEGKITRRGAVKSSGININIEEDDFYFTIRDDEQPDIIYQRGMLKKQKKENENLSPLEEVKLEDSIFESLIKKVVSTDLEAYVLATIAELIAKTDLPLREQAILYLKEQIKADDMELALNSYRLLEKVYKHFNIHAAVKSGSQWDVINGPTISVDAKDEIDRIMIYKEGILEKECFVDQESSLHLDAAKEYKIDGYKGKRYMSSRHIMPAPNKIKSMFWQEQQDNISRIYESYEKGTLAYSGSGLTNNEKDLASIQDEKRIQMRPLSTPLVTLASEGNLEFFIAEVGLLLSLDKKFYVCGRKIEHAFLQENEFRIAINNKYVSTNELEEGSRFEGKYFAWIEDEEGIQVSDSVLFSFSEDLEIENIDRYRYSKSEARLISSVKESKGTIYDNTIKHYLGESSTEDDFVLGNHHKKIIERFSKGGVEFEQSQVITGLLKDSYFNRIFDSKFFNEPIRINRSTNEVVLPEAFRKTIAIVEVFSGSTGTFSSQYIKDPIDIKIDGQEYAIISFMDTDTYACSGFAIIRLGSSMSLLSSWNLETEVI